MGIFDAIRNAVFVDEAEEGGQKPLPPTTPPAIIPPLVAAPAASPRSATLTGAVSDEDVQVARELVARITKVSERADLSAFLEALRDLGEDTPFDGRVRTTLRLASRMKISVSGLLVDAGSVLATIEEAASKTPESLRANIEKIDAAAASQRTASSGEIAKIDVEVQALQARRADLVQELQSLDARIEQEKGVAARRSEAIGAELKRAADMYGQLIKTIEGATTK